MLHAIHQAAAGESTVPTEIAWIAWAKIFRVIGHLLRWDTAVQAADVDAERHLRAAQRQAEILAAGTLALHALGDLLLRPMLTALTEVAHMTQPGEVAGLARSLAPVPLQVRAVSTPDRKIRSSPSRDDQGQGSDQAVGICRLDGVLVTNAHVLRPDEVHDLGLEIRLTEWPDQATALEVTFLTVLSPDQARLPSFVSPGSPRDDGIYRLSGSGSLSISFSLPAGAAPLAFPVAARFTGPGIDEVFPVAGHAELRLRPFDATTDGLTRRPQLDERIVDMYTVLHGKNLNAEDVQAFCRLYTAIAGKAVDIQFERSYMRGEASPSGPFTTTCSIVCSTTRSWKVGCSGEPGQPLASWTSSTTGSTPS